MKKLMMICCMVAAFAGFTACEEKGPEGYEGVNYIYLSTQEGKTTLYDKDAPNGMRVGETEIDLLAIGPGENEYLVGECKYKVDPFTYSEYHKARVKLTPIKENTTFYYALFSRSGFDEKIQAEAEANSSIQLFDLPQIVNYK